MRGHCRGSLRTPARRSTLLQRLAPAAAPAPTKPASQAIATNAQSPDNPAAPNQRQRTTRNQGAPPASKASAPAKASALRPPRPKRLLPPSPQNLRAQANRSSQSACGGPCDRRLGARLLHQRGLVRRRKQCAQGAVSAAERGAARVSPDAGWRQGHPRARAGGDPYASRSQAEAAAATVKTLGLEAVVFRKQPSRENIS